MLQRVSALWNTFLVQVLGLTPIPDAKGNNGQDQSDAEDEGAFELLRVLMHFPAPWRALFVQPRAARCATALPPASLLVATET